MKVSLPGRIFLADYFIDIECPTHLNGECEILYCISGEICVNVNRETFLVTEGNAILILPFEYHTFTTKKGGRSLRFVFSQEYAPSFYDNIRNMQVGKRVFTADTKTVEFVEMVLEDEASPLLPENTIYPFCRLALTQCAFLENGREFELFIKTISYMSKYFNKEITLESTAREMGVHYVHLSRIFKKKSGYSFTWYLNLMKFSYAERLLRTTDKTITEISYESGFGSLRNFNRIFSGITDMTPTEYKKKKKEHKW